MLRNLTLHLTQSGITLVLADVKPQVRDVVERTGLIDVARSGKPLSDGGHGDRRPASARDRYRPKLIGDGR